MAKTPEWTANAEISHYWNFNSSSQITASVNWSYTDELWNDVLNSPELLRDDLHLLGARLSYENFEQKWSVTLQGNNLTDEEYIVAGNAEIAASQFGYIQGTYARPREIWVSIRKDF